MAAAMKRLLKFLHEVGSVGLMGALLCHVALLVHASHLPPAEYLVVRRAIEVITRLVLFPSLIVVLLSGLLSIAVHSPFHNAGWVWVKAALGVPVLEGTLAGVQGTARDAAELAAKVAAGQPIPADAMADVMRHEWGGLGVITVLSLVNIMLAVWRPRLVPRSK
jgi:hypothetical protein